MKNIKTYINHIREQKESQLPEWLLENPDAWVVFSLKNGEASKLVGVYSTEEEAENALNTAVDNEFRDEIKHRMAYAIVVQQRTSMASSLDNFDLTDSMINKIIEDYAKNDPDGFKELWAEERTEAVDSNTHDVEYVSLSLKEIVEIISDDLGVDIIPVIDLIEENADRIYDPGLARYFSRKIKTKRLFGL